MLILIAHNKRLGAPNITQKTTCLCQVPLLRKSRKPPQMSQNRHFWGKLEFFEFFIIIFSVTVLGKDRCFFVLRSVPQDASFELSKTTFVKHFKFFAIRDPIHLGGKGENKLAQICVILPRKQDYF